MSIINLEGVEKVYRTSEIETIALENVNLRIEKGNVHQLTHFTS